MTDNEIINGLECCVNKRKCKNCDFNKYDTCFVVREKEILDLINRQKEEIERLKKENEAFAPLGKLYSEIKGDAYNEFAERLKERAFVPDLSPTGARVVEAWEIDNLLTELTERKEDEGK